MDRKIKRGLSALMLALSLGSVACGDDGESDPGDNAPDLDNNGGNQNDGSNDDNGDNGASNNGSANDGENNGAATGDNNTGSTGDDDCVSSPKAPEDFLNSCPPEGVERREFDNQARLPSSYQGPGQPLPDLP